MNSRSRLAGGCLCLLLLFGGWTVIGQRIASQAGNGGKLPRLHIERSMIYTPQNSWLYNHHPSITHFKGLLIALWSDGMKDEDAPGQRVVFSVSRDFLHWSTPEVFANPSLYKGDTAGGRRTTECGPGGMKSWWDSARHTSSRGRPIAINTTTRSRRNPG